MTAAATQTQPKTAMLVALDRGLAKQAQAAKAKAPAAPRKPAAPNTVAALAAQIVARDRVGALALEQPATALAQSFCVDVAFLQSAMVAAGFVRIRRGPTAELFFGRKTK